MCVQLDTVPGSVGDARAAALTVGLGCVSADLHPATVKVSCGSKFGASPDMICVEVWNNVLVTRLVKVVVSIA